ncbi:Di-copper centre-containing protein [Coprinellus micaceus]|uniref:Di-copper centre-containing protein n=1 Tax=Coprinellus micaceus TaxID=71717 RepID=A0A4Y7SUH7_COPMI|nr:Di-copper centre-containing protein [Coprinellus micaceus]
MVPRTFYTLIALCFAVLVSAKDEQKYVRLDKDATVEGTKCEKLAVRQEWCKYIEAVKCLQSTPATNLTGVPSAMTRYDEFVYTHSLSANGIHGVGQFLPWHRHFGRLYEESLRETCKYEGPLPYWDWDRDTSGDKPISASPIFDPKNGFGGDGVPGTYTVPTDNDNSTYPLIPAAFKGCVGDGPFAAVTMHVGPNLRFTDHCLTRGFNEDVRPALSSAHLAGILSQGDYDSFWNALDGLPFKPEPRLHDAGHGYIGGEMTSFYTSNNDPVFYLHHTGLDRIWWQWQQADLANRLYAMGGKVNNTPPYGQVTLDYTMEFPRLSTSASVRSAMDIRAEPYCYTYDNGALARGFNVFMMALPFLVGAYYL